MFVEHPGSVVAPVGAQIRLTCSVMDGYVIRWRVTLPGTSVALAIEDSLVANRLRDLGIEVLASTNSRNSFLAINGIEENNQTSVTCLALNQADVTMNCESEESRFLLHGNNLIQSSCIKPVRLQLAIIIITIIFPQVHPQLLST